MIRAPILRIRTKLQGGYRAAYAGNRRSDRTHRTHFLPLFPLILALATAHLAAQTGNDACLDCHDDANLESNDGRLVGVLTPAFQSSVHSDLECTDCHSSPGDYEDIPHLLDYAQVDCGTCHDDAAEEYRGSTHDLARIRGDQKAATCVDCHGSHAVLPVDDLAAPVHPANIPILCGRCHADRQAVTRDFVRLPIALPHYLDSVHGEGWKKGLQTAVCTDCHGSHNLRHARDPLSTTNHANLATTCGNCHEAIADEYELSVHGRAVAHGLDDAPTCTDCHDEHVIKNHLDPKARVSADHRAREVCGNCHSDPEIVARYGVSAGVVPSYLDSYHGWAVDRGSTIAATCTDCHNVHEVRSTLDPASSVHPSQVVATCRRCHANATTGFAQSYTHQGAASARGIHDWVRIFYVTLIIVVLGGMLVHNLIVARYEFRHVLRRRRQEPYVQRWHRAERYQHLGLMITFLALAITGFALRFPDSWWVRAIGLGGRETLRAEVHRWFAIVLVVQSVFHALWMLLSRRGRRALREMAPRRWDVSQAIQNIAFNLGFRKERPAFRTFDYTQKTEYWAVIWGTIIMTLTGLVLWFPVAATSWFPSSIVRVSEVIHFYEAILAVSAIFVWHFFYVVLLPSEYPFSSVWLDGRQSAKVWKTTHRAAYDELGPNAIEYPSGSDEKLLPCDPDERLPPSPPTREDAPASPPSRTA